MAPFLMVPRTRGIINFGIPQRCLFFVVYQSPGLKTRYPTCFVCPVGKKEVHLALPSLNASAMRQRHTIKSNLEEEGKGKAYDETAVTSSGALFGSI